MQITPNSSCLRGFVRGIWGNIIVQDAVISVSNLRKRFNLEAGFFARLGRYVNAVNGVTLAIGRNETYGLVGESGCGKTTTARLLVRMYEAD